MHHKKMSIEIDDQLNEDNLLLTCLKEVVERLLKGQEYRPQIKEASSPLHVGVSKQF